MRANNTGRFAGKTMEKQPLLQNNAGLLMVTTLYQPLTGLPILKSLMVVIKKAKYSEVLL